MERLTSRKGNEIYIECGDRLDITPEEMNKLVKNRLAAYEDIGAPEEFEAYKDTGLTPEEFKESADFVLELNKKLKPYLEAEQEGRLVVLPCKVGDTVYVVDRGKILEEKVMAFSTFKTNKTITAMTVSYGYYVTKPNINDLGVLRSDNRLSFFFSREEAERALEVSG